jgi:hypothetical protein
MGLSQLMGFGGIWANKIGKASPTSQTLIGGPKKEKKKKKNLNKLCAVELYRIRTKSRFFFFFFFIGKI